MTNWDLIKTQFEVLGNTKEQICDEHDVSGGMLDHAIKTGDWSAPTTCNSSDPGSDSEIDKLNQEATLLHARHQSTLIPKYIAIETSFLGRLQDLATSFTAADEAKKIAETLTLLKPSIMKQADGEKTGAGGNRIMVVNQFPVPQPGDEHYIAPNAVLIGANAGEAQSFEMIEVPEFEEMN